jgi:glucuronate isomerase
MFTTSPSLAQRIERMIGETPIVDPYTHLKGDQPAAPDLAALLLGDPGMRIELRAVGLPAGDLDPALPAEERVRRAIPYLGRMRNTAVAWGFFRILRDLYDLHEGELTEANYRDVAAKVAASGSDPDWPRAVLRDRLNLRAVATAAGAAGTASNPLSKIAFGWLDLRALLGFSWEAGDLAGALRTTLGTVPDSPSVLDRALRDWLDRSYAGSVRFSVGVLPIPSRGDDPEAETVASALGLLARGEEVDVRAGIEVRAAIARSVLGWHDERGKTLHIVVGGERAGQTWPNDPALEEEGTVLLPPLFRRYPGARFALLAPSRRLGREAANLARHLPNVYAAGEWGADFVPGEREALAALRFHLTPMAKFCGFASDASCVEWIYGKYVLTRKALAAALAGLVERGFYEEDELPPMLRQVLHDTPRDLYDLHPAS